MTFRNNRDVVSARLDLVSVSENWEQEPPAPAPSHAEAKALADRFGTLKAGIKERQTELDEVREALESFFEEYQLCLCWLRRFSRRITSCPGESLYVRKCPFQ